VFVLNPKIGANAFNQHIMLEHISSVQNNFSSHIIFLIVGAIALLYAFMNRDEQSNFMTIGIVVGIVCVVLYFITRKHVLTIGSSSAKMEVEISENGSEMMLEFMDRVAEAIVNRQMVN
jgi:Na+/melibiose symporter-like transporter